MNRHIGMLLQATAAVLGVATAAGAADGKGGISISASVTPIGGLDGSEDFWAEEPDYSAPFSEGWGLWTRLQERRNFSASRILSFKGRGRECW